MKRILTIAAAVTLLAWQSMYGAPTKYLDVDVNWQQMQELETLHIQQGADMQLRVRPKLDGAWLTLTGLTARWEARQYATNAAAYSRASNLTSNQAHFIQMELTSAQTGTAYTNWIYSVILIEGAAEYPIGQGTVHVWPSAFAGSSAELVGSGYQTNGVAASPVSTVNFGTGISSTLVSNKLTLSVASGAGGDITGVTAGTWLSGGGSSGEVTVSADTNAVMDAVAGKGYLTAESDTAAIAALGVHTNLALAESGHGPELDPVWAAVSNTVIPGAAAGATALQAEADTLDAVTGRGQTTTRALGFSSDTTADSMIYHTQTDEILGAVAGPANLLGGGAYWLAYGASHGIGPRLALNGNGGPIEIMSQTTMVEGNGVPYTNAGPIYAESYAGDGSALTNLNATQLTSGTVPLALLANVTTNQMAAATVAQIHAGGGATNIVAGSSDSYNFATRTVTWNTNAAAGGSGGASALADLSDVAPLTGAASGQQLTYNGSIWTNDYGPTKYFAELTISTAQNNVGAGVIVVAASQVVTNRSCTVNTSTYRININPAGLWYMWGEVAIDGVDAASALNPVYISDLSGTISAAQTVSERDSTIHRNTASRLKHYSATNAIWLSVYVAAEAGGDNPDIIVGQFGAVWLGP